MKNILISVSLVALTLLLVAAPAGSAGGGKPRRIAKGTWGAPHIRVEVSDQSATIEYDCAHGQIDGPLVLDRRGRFNLKGTHTRESPGPIRVDSPPVNQPARYSGWTDGKRMTLTVTLIKQRETVGTYSLTIGGGGRIFKCR